MARVARSIDARARAAGVEAALVEGCRLSEQHRRRHRDFD
jgi:hypothetical protein